MALEQRGPTAYRLRRTEAAITLDPSEKGAINYFLGLTVCKLFADQLLNAPWMMHFDVFRPLLNPVLTGRSRPDLVGQTLDGRWVALECKGRASPPDATSKQKAKHQAQRVVSVDGTAPSFLVGGFAYFKNDVLEFYWVDPEPHDSDSREPIGIRFEGNEWRHHYAPTLELIQSRHANFERMLNEPILVPIEEADIQIGIHPRVLRLLLASKWDEARRGLIDSNMPVFDVPYKADGIAVVAGKSWLRPFEESTDRPNRVDVDD
jgi:hypothetical protein